MNHQNKIALVTGSSRGLGRNIALQLARSDADVVVTYRTGKADGEAVAAEIRALGRRAVTLQLDTARTDTFAAFSASLKTALAATWGRETFDFLINN
ncbi:MAG: SDR family NAD(P)-dependent oxidoreductase, partial [Rariglobus sp.]